MEDAEVTLEKAGIREGGAQPRLKRVRGFVCDVCYDDETKETLALTCDHRCELRRVLLALPRDGERLSCGGRARLRLALTSFYALQSARPVTATT